MHHVGIGLYIGGIQHVSSCFYMFLGMLVVIFLFQLGSYGVTLLMCLNTFVMEEG